MINSIIDSIGISLNAEFGDKYTIYSESIEQGLKEPCFFISCLNGCDFTIVFCKFDKIFSNNRIIAKQH